MKKDFEPLTKVKNPEPKNVGSKDWIVWAAWADRITFEQIFCKTGLKEKDVIKIMRKNLSNSSFKLWRKRARSKSIKHLKLFKLKRKNLKPKYKKTIFSS
tara:strand:+ start:2518 stop:2817 length:300 start_codon:yes stop_codon:yes gene_type:complete